MKKMISLFFLLSLLAILSSCKNSDPIETTQSKSGAYYEIFVRSFADSNNDGIGDLNGVTSKLDYLQDLGVNGIWLMPIFLSPSYHGYDTIDYYTINPDYGTKDDFLNLLTEAHKRNIRVMLDLVINHTSNQNEWFLKSEQGDPTYSDYYTWIDPKTDYRIRTNSAAWRTDSANNLAYFGYFDTSMPDLNYSNPAVKDDIFNIGKYWLEQGVDGYRLDAAMFIFSDGEDPFYTPQHNYDFWEEFRTEMRSVNPNVYIVGEVWENAALYAPYYQCLDSSFDFDLANTIISTDKSTGGQYTSKLQNYYDLFSQYDPNFIDAPFLRNHDQIRSATELNGDINLEKMAAEMLLALPGNPFIYYGEEIGMLGYKSTTVSDLNVRQPFLWGDPSITPTWFIDTYNTETSPLSVQENDANSLYNVYKAMLSARNANIALSDGTFEPYTSDNARLQGYYRVYQSGKTKQLLFVLHNLSNKNEYDLPTLSNAKLIYESYGKNGFVNNKIASQSTIIVELPYSDYSKYITE